MTAGVGLAREGTFADRWQRPRLPPPGGGRVARGIALAATIACIVRSRRPSTWWCAVRRPSTDLLTKPPKPSGPGAAPSSPGSAPPDGGPRHGFASRRRAGRDLRQRFAGNRAARAVRFARTSWSASRPSWSRVRLRAPRAPLQAVQRPRRCRRARRDHDPVIQRTTRRPQWCRGAREGALASAADLAHDALRRPAHGRAGVLTGIMLGVARPPARRRPCSSRPWGPGWSTSAASASRWTR